MKFLAYGAFLFKDLYFDLGRSLLTVVSMTAVIVSFLAASAVAEVFRKYGSQPQNGSGELLILSEYALEPMQSRMDLTILQQAVEIVQKRYGNESITSSFPVIYRTLEINSKTMQVMAIPRENMLSSQDLTLEEGQWPLQDNEIAVTDEGLRLNHWKMGDRIHLRGVDLLITGRVREETVTSVIWMLYSSGQALFDAQDDFQIGVLRVAPGLRLPVIQAALEGDSNFPAGYAVYLNQQLYERYSEMVSDLVRVASIISLLALLVIGFGTFNATSLTMTERKQDLAILQTLGFGPRVIGFLLLGRALVQVLAAFLLAWGIVALIVRNSLQDPVIFFARMAVLRLSVGTVAGGFGLTLISASLGVWLTLQAQHRQTLADQLRE